MLARSGIFSLFLIFFAKYFGDIKKGATFALAIGK